ncbi:translocase of outer mitochondrial membrane [Tieghemiomyces parasiticus]|uniref:Translocase of outer mitochondrial membrane n=1 Tax=Tieghemiomyces parasiticus TaxID=78921 RepID=A0A9W8AFN2_9FUNG|nr:translocase of outer mitochondrial membrane [Tieghemiomyces parasiticus]
MSAPAIPIEKAPVAKSPWSPFGLFSGIQNYRKSLGLTNPGTVEMINKEQKNTFLTNYFFEGARADLTKVLSPNFQVTHTLSLATGGAPSSYSFAAVYAGPEFLIHGTVDNDGMLQSRVHYSWTPSLLTKAQMLFMNGQGQNMLQAEADYQGADYSINLKAVNPSPTDNTGIYAANYLQSITKRLAVGAETVLEKPPMGEERTRTALLARYDAGDSIGTLQWQGTDALHATYYQKVSDKVEVGAELQVSTESADRRGAIYSVGAKYEFRQAAFRGLIDSAGKVSAVLEEKMAPGFSFLMTAEVDHMKGQNKVGLGLALES